MQRTLTKLEDDLDPAREATRTVPFSFDGKHYLIDLDEQHYIEMRERFYAYTVAGREVKPKAAVKSKKARRRTPPERSAAIRAFARERNIPCSDRGRIPSRVIAEWEAAQQSGTVSSPGRYEATFNSF